MLLTSGLYYKSFTMVTYYYNDSTLYHKTMLQAKAGLVLAKLSLTMSVNNECKVLKTEVYLMIVIYARKMFIVQAAIVRKYD